jgi:hypothetical protein
MGFAHGPGAGMQPPHHAGHLHHGLAEQQHIRPNQSRGRIREVWAHNLNEEMAVLRDLVDKYPYIAMVRTADTRLKLRRFPFGLQMQLYRTPNSPVSYQDRWEDFGGRVTTIINAYERTWICSRLFRSG